MSTPELKLELLTKKRGSSTQGVPAGKKHLAWVTNTVPLRDATVDYSDREMHASLDVNIPSYASAIVTTKEVVEAIACP